MEAKKYYIAYGSNLSRQQMAQRCPGAKIVGGAVLKGWQLLFGYYATVEPAEGKGTPVLVWEITSAQEQQLDEYEDYPKLYRKAELAVECTPLDEGTPQPRWMNTRIIPNCTARQSWQWNVPLWMRAHRSR